MKSLIHNSKTLHGSPRSGYALAVGPIPISFPPFSTIDSCFPMLTAPLSRFRAYCHQLQHLSSAPFNLHIARVRRASGFLLTAFSNARLNLRFALSTQQRRASEKALASLGRDPAIRSRQRFVCRA
jgi:hypothetical protein